MKTNLTVAASLFWCSTVSCFWAWPIGPAQANADACAGPGVVAHYEFEGDPPGVVLDCSGNGNNGVVVGGDIRVKGAVKKAILLRGTNWIRVPHSTTLDLRGPISVSAWLFGRPSPLRFVEGYPGLRGPAFQVVGDQIYLATNSDDRPPNTNPKDSDIATWTDAWNLWTGTADIALNNWTYVRRTMGRLSALEPKLQVVGDNIFYEYFGQDEKGVWQIYVAFSRANGGGWKTTQLTHETARPGVRSSYFVEQADNIRVVGRRIFFGYPHKDTDGKWRLVFARVDVDGKNTVLRTETSEGGWIPSIQIVGEKVYYMYVRENFDAKGPVRARYELLMATSDLDGQHWHKFPSIASGNWITTGSGAFAINGHKIFLSYPRVNDPSTGWSSLVTSVMNLDGTSRIETTRVQLHGFVGVPRGGVQIIGNEIYYVFNLLPTAKTIANVFDNKTGAVSDAGRLGFEYWTANSKLDGTNWIATKRTPPPADSAGSYKAMQLVGAKFYTSTMHWNAYGLLQEMLGVGGANIVSKGDSYGIGVTETGSARAFINAGQDYLFNGLAPEDAAGSIADHEIGRNNWHHVVSIFDRKVLSLYIDGKLQARERYEHDAAKNSMPLLIGDGFYGAIADIVIFNRALTDSDVVGLFQGRQNVRR